MTDYRAPEASREVMDTLQKIYQHEMEGVSRYLHYSFMIMGPNRIPIQKWFRDQANEASAHAIAIGEKITSYGGHPTMSATSISETNVHAVDQILKESLEFEAIGLGFYKTLVHAAGSDIALEEMAREFVKLETEHLDEVVKMLRRGDK